MNDQTFWSGDLSYTYHIEKLLTTSTPKTRTNHSSFCAGGEWRGGGGFSSLARVFPFPMSAVARPGTFTCGAHEWFEKVLNVREAEWLRILDADPASLVRVSDMAVGDRRVPRMEFVPVGLGAGGVCPYSGGSFSVWSVEQLRDAGTWSSGKRSGTGGVKDVPLQVFVRRHERVPADLVDVHVLQSQSTPGTMFQVASNFNCLEAANEMVDYGSGMFVTKLMTDRTQGPAAGSSCPCTLGVCGHRHLVAWGRGRAGPAPQGQASGVAR
jgi:hypothetical protein